MCTPYGYATITTIAFLRHYFSVSLTKACSKEAPSLPGSTLDARPAKRNPAAVFTGGVFWCTEAVF